MRLERRKGNMQRMRAVEREHRRVFGQDKPYWQIAVEIYADHSAQIKVAEIILARYGVRITAKTAGTWINTGIHNLQVEAAAGSLDRETAREPVRDADREPTGVLV